MAVRETDFAAALPTPRSPASTAPAIRATLLAAAPAGTVYRALLLRVLPGTAADTSSRGSKTTFG